MSKRRPLLRVLAVAALAGGSFAWGFAAHKYEAFPYGLLHRGLRAWRHYARRGDESAAPPGLWRPARPDAATADDREDLLALPYLQGYHPAPAGEGVTVHRRDRAFDGLNLYVSGHASGAFLMDMEGNELHRWHYEISDVWPDQPKQSKFWRRAHLFPNGDVLAIFDGVGVIKVDRESKLLWSYAGGCHHDVDVGDDGRIWVLNRKTHVVPRIHRHEPVDEDSIAVLDGNGRELQSFSVLEAFERSSYAPLLHRMKPWGDIFHTNTIELFDGRLAERSPLYRKGNLLISVRELDTIAIVDPQREVVVWALTGQWKRQHQPTLLDDGNFLLFDNEGAGGHAKVMELDPFTQAIVWQYDGEPGQPLTSRDLGSSQRLRNGNTLISESKYGRAVEVTRDGEIAWEFLNPHRAGESNELIATLFEMIRLRWDFTPAPFWGAGRG